MIRETFPVGPVACNCTILGDEVSREAIVVDPGADIQHILALLVEHQLTVMKIVVTHAHFDHIAGSQELKRITGAPIVYNQAELPLVAMMDQQPGWIGLSLPSADVRPPDHSPADGEIISVRGIDAEIIYTPGHTMGSVNLYLPTEQLLLAGDTLFTGSIGRTDFPFGNHNQLIASIRERIMPLPAETVVVPGHGPDTTIGDEARTNPFLV